MVAARKFFASKSYEKMFGSCLAIFHIKKLQEDFWQLASNLSHPIGMKNDLVGAR
jgi:hypothetical protein